MSKVNLTQASSQWANRPADERFWDLPELIAARKASADSSQEKHEVPFSSLRVAHDPQGLALVGPAGNPAYMTHYAFGQLCADVGAPASYLRGLSPSLAVSCLAEGMQGVDQSRKASLLLQQNGHTTLRAVTSDRYTRVWDHEIAKALADNLPQGWRVPPARPCGEGGRTRPATREDVLRLVIPGLSIKEGDLIGPAGLYASDRDMFVFMVNEDVSIDDGTGHELGRGFFLWNSEVGAKSFGITTFLFDAVCGNHIVWGAQNVRELKLRHIGDADRKSFSAIRMDLTEYAQESSSGDSEKIRKARSYLFGASKKEALENLIGLIAKKRVQLTQGQCAQAMELAEASPRYGDPKSLWGIVSGLTELSQKSEYADRRVSIDRAAGKLLEIAF